MNDSNKKSIDEKPEHPEASYENGEKSASQNNFDYGTKATVAIVEKEAVVPQEAQATQSQSYSQKFNQNASDQKNGFIPADSDFNMLPGLVQSQSVLQQNKPVLSQEKPVQKFNPNGYNIGPNSRAGSQPFSQTQQN